MPLRGSLDTECEDFARVLEVNLVGPFRLTKALAGSMAAARARAWWSASAPTRP